MNSGINKRKDKDKVCCKKVLDLSGVGVVLVVGGILYQDRLYQPDEQGRMALYNGHEAFEL